MSPYYSNKKNLVKKTIRENLRNIYSDCKQKQLSNLNSLLKRRNYKNNEERKIVTFQFKDL